MKKIALMLIILLVAIHGVCQTLPSQQLQYKFLRWYLDANPPKKLSKKFDNFANANFIIDNFDFNYLRQTPEVKRSDLKITDVDSVFIKMQIVNNNKKKRIKKDSLMGVTNIDWHTWGDPDLPVTLISLPVFSVDGNTVFISRYYHCGRLCGNGYIEIYRKVDGRWKRFPVDFWGKWNN